MTSNATTPPEKTPTTRWPWAFAALVCVAGSALTVHGWRIFRQMERRAIEDEFRTQAAALAQRISRETRMTVELLESISHLHTISDRILPEDFAEFVAKGMRFHTEVLGAFGFVQQMDEAMRLLLETSDTNAMQIVQRDPNDLTRFVGAPAKGVYFPLTYQYPKNGLGLPIGFDFSTDRAYADAIVRLLNTGQTVMGGAAPARSENERFYIFAPIVYVLMSGGDRRPVARSLAGFTVGLFSPRETVLRALGGEQTVLERAGWQVEWSFSEDAPQGVGDISNEGRLIYDEGILVADTPWRIRLSVAVERFIPPGRSPSIGVLVGGLGITLLLTLELLLMAGRNRRIEKLVAARTAALREAKEHLEREMRRRAQLEEEILSISTREKVRVGQDLHDSLGQKLTGAVLLSRALSRRLAAIAPEHAADGEALHNLLKDSVAQVRRMAQGLAPVELGERGLVGALEQLVEEMGEAAQDVECVLESAEVKRAIPPKVAQHLFHIAQEAVTNALRHAQARRIIVTLRTNEKTGELIVEDDGRGFDPVQFDGGGLGLEIMKHRADLIGARLEFGSAAKKGTRIVCTFRI